MTNTFAVLLGDTLVKSEDVPVTKQLIDVYDKYRCSVVALEEVKPEMIQHYGVIEGKPLEDNVFIASDWVEKPLPEEAPSNLAVASRYIFTPEIFDYLEQILPGKNGEIQLTDAMRLMVKHHAMVGLKFKGKRYDIGNKLGFLKTNLIYGLEDDEIGGELKEWLKTFTQEL